MSRFLSNVVILLSLALVSCADDNSLDGSSKDDYYDSSGGFDGTGAGDSGDSTGGNINLPPESCNSIPSPFIAPNDLVGFVSTSSTGSKTIAIEGAQADNVFSLTFTLGNEPFNPSIAPGVYQIDENQSDPKTCGLCASIVNSLNTDNNQYLHLLAAFSGELNLTATGTQNGAAFSGVLSNVSFREVEEAGDAYADVENGCTSTIQSLAFDVILQSPPN